MIYLWQRSKRRIVFYFLSFIGFKEVEHIGNGHPLCCFNGFSIFSNLYYVLFSFSALRYLAHLSQGPQFLGLSMEYGTHPVESISMVAYFLDHKPETYIDVFLYDYYENNSTCLVKLSKLFGNVQTIHNDIS